MKTIMKFRIPVLHGLSVIDIPYGTRILSVVFEKINDNVYVIGCSRTTYGKDTEKLHIACYPPGDPMTDKEAMANFLGTVVTDSKVVHIFSPSHKLE